MFFAVLQPLSVLKLNDGLHSVRGDLDCLECGTHVLGKFCLVLAE